MTKSDILTIINEYNANLDIKWFVDKNTKYAVTISNDYCGKCSFTISIDDFGIMCFDNNTDSRFGCMIKGDDRWSDYTDDNDGLTRAIIKVVKHFYYYY